MADLVEKVNELQALPASLHLFCPRDGPDDGSIYYPEDIAGIEQSESEAEKKDRLRKLEEAQDRTVLTFDALQVLAFDGEDAEPYKKWLQERLDRLLTSCDICVRIFHKSRGDWKQRLIEQFDEDAVGDFLGIVDGHSLKRIENGLHQAYEVLIAADEKSRSVRILPSESTYAFFEALSCDALIRNHELLRQHFDTPFKLLQTKKRLKPQGFLPAMTRFLFDSDNYRREWAEASWRIAKRNITSPEFDWAVRDYLTEAILRVQMSNLDLEFVSTFWVGARLIVSKLDKDLINDNLRELRGNFYRLLLDHLSLNSNGFFDLVATMCALLKTAPVAFWDAMDNITPSGVTVAEQVFNSPVLNQFLKIATNDTNNIEGLAEAFAWIRPFLESTNPANLAPVCRTIANQLLGRFQSNEYSVVAREYCLNEGLRMLDYAFGVLIENSKTKMRFVGQPTINGMLTMLSKHIETIVATIKRPKTERELDVALNVIQKAFTLECRSLDIEKQCIHANEPSPTETPPSKPLWTAVIRAINPESIELATRLLSAGRHLIGLEPLPVKVGASKVSPTLKHYNNRFKVLTEAIAEVLERLGEFNGQQLDAVFDDSRGTSSIVATLFSSDENTRSATLELLKVLSEADERRGALLHILDAFYQGTLSGISDSCKQITKKQVFAPAPTLVKTCADVIDIMCNNQDGLLRKAGPLGNAEARATMVLWEQLWRAMESIFRTTEQWSNMGTYDKHEMMEFCRDTMQFAEQLFEHCSIFSTALEQEFASATGNGKNGLLGELLKLPTDAMGGIVKWLRLRDDYLSKVSVSLISKLLTRLHDVAIEIDPDTLDYIQRVITGDIRAKLSMQQQAELQSAVETHLGRPMIKEEEPVKQQRQGSLNKWMHTGSKVVEGKPDRKAQEGDARARLLAHAMPTANAFGERRESMKAREQSQFKAKQESERKAAAQAEFLQKRKAEMERVKREKELAKQKKSVVKGFSNHTAEAGSGIEGLGILGKDQARKGEGLMHSSDESEDDEDFDEELFGARNVSKHKTGPKINIINEVKVQMPVKKRRVVRSVKDMRARLAPDLSQLHKTILEWEYYHEGDFPPNSNSSAYSAVPSKFRSAYEYQNTFEPLLTLEAWQGFVKAREENVFKPYEIRIVSRASVDQFQEVSSTMTHAENKEVQVSEGDVVLLSKSRKTDADDPHCLARVFRVSRKKEHVEVSYRVVGGSNLQSYLAPKGTIYGAKIQSITPLEREYGALVGLQYYDLCDEIVRAQPSPLLNYKDSLLEPLISNYNVNKAQAKAVKSAIDNDAFTLIQGPPGSGKTKTIVAIVGAVLSDNLRQAGTAVRIPGQGATPDAAPKKLLVCAPSNAAVDELVMRFKDGVKTLSGQHQKLNIVRLGRSDAINANVQDVTLEELVNKELGVNPSNNTDAEDKRKVFEEHKQISKQIQDMRLELDSGAIKGEAASKLQDDFNELRRRKALLGKKIDDVKDSERTASRNADLSRRKAQEKVLGNAHVICATLSGSGHDMFQSLNIEFETVIVDEAAQCVEMSALIPLKYGCAKCILVGDPKQLPPTVFSKEAARFQYEQSLFVRMQNNHPKDVHLLDTQYRMHPEISVFPSQTFYDGRLLDGDNMAGLRQRPWHASRLLGPYQFYDVQGQHSAAPKGHSLINKAEIDIAMKLYARLTSDFRNYDFKGKVGIITPYKSQLKELKYRFAANYGESILEDIEFNTTDAFQGRESEVIIFSCVRASPAGGIGFLQDIRRMNVGLTRAKSSLWVLGNSQSLVRGQYWRKLVEDAKRRNRYIGGNLETMLRQHSSSHPAPKWVTENKPAPPLLPTQVKEEARDSSMSRASSVQSGSSYAPNPVKTEPTNGVGLAFHGKRKSGEDDEGDIEMRDASSGSEGTPASASNVASNRSTPAPTSRSSPLPGVKQEVTDEPGSKPADVLSGMVRPKIRKRPRAPANPLMQRPPPKKPRPS